jgi:hypothetical protein
MISAPGISKDQQPLTSARTQCRAHCKFEKEWLHLKRITG